MKTIKPAHIDRDAPVRMIDLVNLTSISRATIYKHCKEGYAFKYSKVRRATVAHYLAWMEAESANPTPSPDEIQWQAERERLLQAIPKPRKAHFTQSPSKKTE